MSLNTFASHLSLSFLSETTMMQIFVSLMSSRCLLNYLHFFFPFFSSCFFSELVISTTLSSTSLICTSAPFTLLLIPYSVFFISVIVVFISVWFFFIFSNSLLRMSNLVCSSSLPSVSLIITLNSLLGRLPVSSSLSSSSGALSCSFGTYFSVFFFLQNSNLQYLIIFLFGYLTFFH